MLFFENGLFKKETTSGKDLAGWSPAMLLPVLPNIEPLADL